MNPFALRLAVVFALLSVTGAYGQRAMENLGRGVIALHKSTSQVYVSWRLLGNEPADVAFNIYRSTNGATPVKLNATPVTATTDFLDTTPDLTFANAYSVRPVINGVEGSDSTAFTLPANSPVRQYLGFPVQSVPSGAYALQQVYLGDVDGDGEWELVCRRIYAGTGTPADGPAIVDCYKIDGTFLWRVKLGANIEGSNDGDGNLAVADFDGDGKAEVVARTTVGTTFNDGTVIADTSSHEFLSVIDGMTGNERTRTGFEPSLGTDPYTFWGPADRPFYLYMAVAYLDGVHPSIVTARGAGANRFQVFAWDYRNGAITNRWSYQPAANLGIDVAHNLVAFDVDNDGKDEIVGIGGVIDDDGSVLYETDLGHGDHFRFFDIDPDRPGYESFAIQQQVILGQELYDGLTGKPIKKWFLNAISDPSRADAADVDPNFRGAEVYSTMANIYSAKGDLIGPKSIFPARSIWWDSDLQREVWTGAGASLMAPAIEKISPSHNAYRLYSIYEEGVTQPYGGYPPLVADILGDWREEVVLDTSDHSELRIYSTSAPATNRLYTLMQNASYRVGETCKGRCGGTQVDYYLGSGMTPPPPPPIVKADNLWAGGNGSNAWNVNSTANWKKAGAAAKFNQGESVLFDLTGNNTSSVLLNGTLTPAAVTVYSPVAYTFAGNGTLAGTMPLTKVGAGSLTLNGTHTFNGTTTVWDGALVVNGNLTRSPVTVYGGVWGGALAGGQTGGRIGGNGTFGGGVTMQYGGAITPGRGMGSVGNLTINGTLTGVDGAVACFDVAGTPGGTSDRLVVKGNLALAGNNTIFINPLTGTLAAGNYTLATYNGTLTGGLENLKLAGLPGVPAGLAITAGAIQLVVKSTRAAASVIWSGANGATWDLATTANWLRSATADLFVPGDSVSFDNSGAANPVVTLAEAVNPSAITVGSSSNYTFSGNGSIIGACGLTKSGNGTLTILTGNEYTGVTTVTGGTLEVSNMSESGMPGSLGSAGTSPANLMLNACTFRLLSGGGGGFTNRGATLGAGGVTFDTPGTATTLTFAGVVAGNGTLTKTGNGTLQFTGNNTFSGGTVIRDGNISLGNAVANRYGLGTGNVTFLGGTLSMANVQASESALWNMIVPTGATGNLTADGRCTLRGTLTGNGTFKVYSPYVRTDLAGDWSQFTGHLDFGGEARVSNTYGYAKAAVSVTDCPIYFAGSVAAAGTTLSLGELSGDATSALKGGPTASNVFTWSVGGLNTDATFAGAINEQGNTTVTAITKVGNGTWTLTGTGSNYRGPTTVAAGTLEITGAIAGSNVTVQNKATLKNRGSIDGDVAVLAGGRLTSAGTITGNLTNNGTVTLAGDDLCVVGGSFVNNGTLDLSLWRGSLPSNFVNKGTIIPCALPWLSITAPAVSPVVVSDRAASLRLTATLTGPAPLTATWSQVSGPGTVTFANAIAADTMAQFSSDGVYILKCLAANASGTDAKQLTVIVGPQTLTFREGVNGFTHTGAMVRSDWTGCNSGARAQMLVGKAGGKMRGVLAYDFSGLPANLEVTSVTLDLWTAAAGTVDDVDLREMSGHVVEGTGNGSTSTSGAGTGLTWASRDGQSGTGHAWTTAGGDFGTTVLSRVTGFTSNSTSTRKTFESGADFVAVAQSALGGGFGLIVVSPVTEAGTISQYATFASDDIANVAQRPLLTVTFNGTQLPAVAAGTAPTAARGVPASLSGSVGNATSTTWSLVSGPGTATFAAPAQAATTVTFAAAGTYIVRLSARNAGGETSCDLVVVVTAYPTVYADWQAAEFPGVTDTTMTGAAADPDRDGMSNFLEFALASSPKSPGFVNATVAAGTGILDYTYTRRKNAAGMTYVVEWSDSLAAGSWSEIGVTQIVVTPDSDLLVQTVKASVPVPPGSKRFVRLRVRMQ